MSNEDTRVRGLGALGDFTDRAKPSVKYRAYGPMLRRIPSRRSRCYSLRPTPGGSRSMGRVLRRASSLGVLLLVALCGACGDELTAPPDVEVAAPTPAYSLSVNGGGVCSQPRSAGWVFVPSGKMGFRTRSIASRCT